MLSRPLRLGWELLQYIVANKSTDVVNAITSYRLYSLGACYVMRIVIGEWLFEVGADCMNLGIVILLVALVFGRRAYRAFYILNWIYRYFVEKQFSRWISCVDGLVQTTLYAGFFYYYFLRKDLITELEEKVQALQTKPLEMPSAKEELLNAAICRVEALEAELIATKK
ncbi:hypothetical protein IFM89_011564, partial [Coptis chinensis]